MRKYLLFAFGLFSILLIGSLIYKKSAPIKNGSSTRMEVAEYEDGKMEAELLEIKKTRNISLGYVPKTALLHAYQQMMTMNYGLKSKRTPTTFPNFTWIERGPNADMVGLTNGNPRPGNGVSSGRIRAILVDKADPTNKTVWAAGIDGGLWKTNDISASPANWILVNDFLGSLGVSTICQDPINNNIMYFGTGEKTPNGDAGQGAGVWKSVDHGQTWNFLPATTAFYNDSKIICDVSGNVYLAVMSRDFAGLLRSSDGGATWVEISPAGLNLAITDLKLSANGRMHIICGYANGHFDINPAGYRFTDNPATVTSNTWTVPAATVFDPTYNVELAVSGNTVYALPSDNNFQTPQIYKSTDGGDHWAATPTSPPVNSSLTSISSGQGWYDLAIAADPANPNNVIAGGLNCYRSNDGGNTWTNVSVWVGNNGNYIHSDQHTALWNGNQVLIGCDGGLFYSSDGARTFTDRNVGLRIKQFYSCAIHPTISDYFLAGAQDNGIHQFSNPGLSSTVEVTGGDGAFVHIDQDEPQYQFGSYVYNNYRRSTDGGQTWSSVNYSGNKGLFINPTDYDDINNKMYCSGNMGELIRWDDPQTGNSFSPLLLANLQGDSVSAVKVSPYNPNTVFIGSIKGQIIKITNTDQQIPTETNISNPQTNGNYISNVELGTSEKDIIYSVSNYGSSHVLYSTNGGTNWTDISGNLPDLPVRWARFYLEDDTKAIIATQLGVWETSLINGAATVWVNDPKFPIVRTDMLQYRQSDGLIAAATHGRGLWTSMINRTIPYIRFAANYSVKTEQGGAISGCRSYHDYTVNMNIDLPPTGDAVVTLGPSGASTATKGIDYDFTTNGNFVQPSNTITFTNGSSQSKVINVRIYDDAQIENQEFFTLNYSISGNTNGTAAPSSQSFTFYINDNDQTPQPVAFTVANNHVNVTNETPFKSTDTKYRLQTIYTANELRAAGLTANVSINSLAINVLNKRSTKPFNSFTINMANSNTSSFQNGFVNTTFTQVYSANYSSVAGVNTFTLNTPFTWDGASNILVQYCFDNTGNTPDNLSDIVDGSDSPLFASYASIYSNSNNTNGAACLLTSSSVSLPRINMTFGLNTGNDIQTVANNPSNIYIANNGNYYFYSADNKVLGNINGASSLIGCVNTNISESGNTWQNFLGGQRSQKVFDISAPANNAQTYNLGIYYTSAELGNLSPAAVKIAVTSAAKGALANASNSSELPTTYQPYGNGYVFSTRTNKFLRFFLVNNTVTLPVTLLSFTCRLDNNFIHLDWETTSEHNATNYEIEKSVDGVHFKNIGSVNAHGNSNVTNHYSFPDTHVDEVNYYRLKMNDVDGKFVYSQIVLIRKNNAEQKIWIEHNPFTNAIGVGLLNVSKTNIIAELYTVSGTRLFTTSYLKSNHINIDVSGITLSNGVYILRIISDGKIYASKVIKSPN